MKLCEQELGWKKSTTYTMLRRLCQRNIFKNKEGFVSSVLLKQEFDALQSEMFVEDTFDGSLPQFFWQHLHCERSCQTKRLMSCKSSLIGTEFKNRRYNFFIVHAIINV